ncbi:uncharacterized protein Z519_10515 [Cladophialophora bantiana CBS 173.52]|uniref:Nucleoporin NSP1-like C-terminal domain-containing protein n=1 Tax=Cladophialophora bantiana (strain ATCC 10958 / CBS 173.52 / CDC B-1940 / NIH 8579) TaxID=1442370 RepID=A0A0D2HDZ2_CLAB1|nr:uncharacterized protein Z519_10515 [Cladophialophora bantiana CBS 173.52]KIW89030.1 hypothetical protein Z519_10515 [Cladophialophora bantiana CBS 173.52]
MAFNFGQPSTSGGSSQSLFGTSNTPASSGGSLSGTNSGFNFGGIKPPATASTQPPNFLSTGGAKDNKPASPSILGQQSGTSGNSASQNLFAPKPQSGESAKSNFGGFGTPDKSSTLTTSAPSLFGSTTPATSKPFGFGTTSTTPAGPPPASSTLAASTGGGGAGLFGAKPGEDASKSTFSWGKPAAAGVAPSGNLFGGSSGGFSFGKPAESTSITTPSMTAASAPEQKSFSFGQPTSAPATSQPAATPLFGEAPKPPAAQNLFAKPATTAAPGSAAKPTFSFGQPSATQASAAATPATSAPAQTPLFSGFNLGGAQSSASTTAAATTTAPAPTASPFSFGPPATSAPAASQPAGTSAPAASPLFGKPAPTTTQPATTSAPTSSPFLFSKPATSATSQPAAPVITAAPAAGTTAAPASVPSAIGVQTSTTGPTPPAQSRLRNKTMDEILTRWATDMSRYSKEFKDHAETIARWDQLIVDNSSKIDKLYVRARTCERQTVSVDMQLTAVENSQAELESWLTKYENDVDEMLAKDSMTPSEMGGPDQERERTYKLAEKLGERLEEMERDLGSMVDEVNAANASLSRSSKGDEPITQIVKILNSHLIQLQAIDQGTQALQEKVAAAQKAASQLGYLAGYRSSSTIDGSDTGAAVQDFYRSYMGRRS